MEVLLAGNTGYVTETFIEESFPECDVVVLGNEMLKSNRKKNILSRPFIKDEKELKEIFETYEFERIVYFSNYLTMHGRMTGELEQLRQILQLCKKNKEIRKTKFWTPMKNGQVLQKKNVTLQQYVRNSIHHPENDKNPTYTQAELQQSIEQMLTIVEHLPL